MWQHHSRLTSFSSFMWTPEAELAFAKLNGLFTSAPVLTQPDPSRQFIVEVDASDSGVGAVLSQRSAPDQKLHPFLSRCPAECNYDVGNRELLAVKLALEEWRHWLEGAVQSFIVWTDHKICTDCQVTKLPSGPLGLTFWLLQVHPHVPPGSKNIKPDTLSHHFASEVPPSPETILSPSCMVGAATWEIESGMPNALNPIREMGLPAICLSRTPCDPRSVGELTIVCLPVARLTF